MRKRLRLLLLLAAAMALLSIPAFADDIVAGESAGIYNVSPAENANVTFVTQTAAGADVSSAAGKTLTVNGSAVNCTNFYPEAEKLVVTYSAATEGNYYLILAQNATGTPTAENLVYIDQVTAGSDKTATFTVYPSSLVSGKAYSVYLTSNEANSTLSTTKPVLTFSYYAPYKLGDVDDSGIVDTSDALQILQHIVKNVTLQGNNFSAADVADPKGTIDTSDALKVLQYIVKNITTFD